MERFWQMSIEDENKDKSIFSSHLSTCNNTQLPFAILKAPPKYQCAVDIVLNGVWWKTCFVKICVAIFTKNNRQHIMDIYKVLTLLQGRETLSFPKCHFFYNKF